MKTKILIPVIFWGAVVIFLTAWVFCAQPQSDEKSKLTVQPIDNKGIFVGERSKAMIAQEAHDRSLRIIDEAEEYIRTGNSYYRASQYEAAVRAYQQAYSIDRGGRAVSGLKLAMTYEKLHRYNEGVALLDEMIAKGYLSEKGIQNANEIKSRLLVSKSSQESTNPQTQ